MTAPPTFDPARHLSRRLIVGVTALVVVGVGVTIFLSGGAADVVGSGVAMTEVRHVGAFNGVELRATNNVSIHVGGAPRVVVNGEDNLVPLVTTDVKNSRLVIGASRGFKTTRPMRVDVTVPTVKTITLAGGGVISASGSVPRLQATLAGVGRLKLTRLAATDVRAVLVGIGRIDVTATRSLHAVVAGSGAIFYGGHPAHLTQEISGKGAVSPK